MREFRIEQALCKLVKARGGLCLKLASELRGFPDRTVLYRGRVLFVEVKRPGGRLSRHQEVMFDKLRGMGFDCLKYDGSDIALSRLNDWMEGE